MAPVPSSALAILLSLPTGMSKCPLSTGQNNGLETVACVTTAAVYSELPMAPLYHCLLGNYVHHCPRHNELWGVT